MIRMRPVKLSFLTSELPIGSDYWFDLVPNIIRAAVSSTGERNASSAAALGDTPGDGNTAPGAGTPY